MELAASGRPTLGSFRMYLKTVTILMWLAASYALLVFAHTNWWQAALLAVSLALAVGATGFAIQHDANHGAYSGNAIVNRLMGATLDLLGASSYLWHWKHNIFHHTYTNIEGADHDLNAKPFGRLAPDQAHYPAHRFQHIYMWALYGFMLPKWHLVDDFQNALEARIDDNRIPRPRGWDAGAAAGRQGDVLRVGAGHPDVLSSLVGGPRLLRRHGVPGRSAARGGVPARPLPRRG